MKYLKVIYPFEGKVSIDTVKRRACDILQDEENRKVDPIELTWWEARDICEHYGKATFLKLDT